MKFTYNWLKDFVDIKVSPKALAEKLTMAGLEVGSCEEKNGDFVFEAEVTSNRPDWLSVLGIAQEAAAITKSKIKNQKSKLQINYKLQTTNYKKTLNIQIQDKKGCAFYRGCLIEGVKVAPSPDWLKNRLEAVGLRSVNNIVDITNYCLLEFGQPLHAFDFDKIVKGIIVRRAKNGEKIVTIDGVERQLDENILVVSDKDKAVAIAGIMGDKFSEVGDSTKNILLESAYFDPLLVRCGSRKLSISTDSSYRFERGVDFDNVKKAQDRAVQLIYEIAGGKFIDEKESGLRIKQKAITIKFDCKKANKILSVNIAENKIKNIFKSLGFSARNLSKDKLLVKIPSGRRDVNMEEDLIEEIARLHGYNNIPSTLPAIRTAVIINSKTESLKPLLRNTLCALGFNEAITYSLVSENLLKAAFANQDILRLSNPLSSQQEYLSPNLRASLLNCLSYNLNRKNKGLKLFEISHIFEGSAVECINLALISSGKEMDSWQINREFDFFILKGKLEALFSQLNIVEFEFKEAQGQFFSQGQGMDIITQDKKIGICGRVDKQTLLNFDIKDNAGVFYAEIFLDEIIEYVNLAKKFKPLSNFPSVKRDLSLACQESLLYSRVISLIKSETAGYLRDVKLVDIYKGGQIPKGFKGWTFSLEYGLDNATLTDEEVSLIQSRLAEKLITGLGVTIR